MPPIGHATVWDSFRVAFPDSVKSGASHFATRSCSTASKRFTDHTTTRFNASWSGSAISTAWPSFLICTPCRHCDRLDRTDRRRSLWWETASERRATQRWPTPLWLTCGPRAEPYRTIARIRAAMSLSGTDSRDGEFTPYSWNSAAECTSTADLWSQVPDCPWLLASSKALYGAWGKNYVFSAEAGLPKRPNKKPPRVERHRVAKVQGGNALTCIVGQAMRGCATRQIENGFVNPKIQECAREYWPPFGRN